MGETEAAAHRRSELGPIQEAQPQQIKVGATKHAPLDQLEPVDMPLQRSVEYTTRSHQLAQLDARKQAGQWVRLYQQVQAAEARLRQAEQETPPSQTSPPETANRAESARTPEYAKRQEAQANPREAARSGAEPPAADERQAQLRALASA